jgi:uncharacterized protein (DUF1015 family)
MPKIIIHRRTENDELMRFSVVVEDENGSTRHSVQLKITDYERLTNSKVTPEELIEKSFTFLLERESKESILEKFDLLIIQKYFPEYEKKIRAQLRYK